MLGGDRTQTVPPTPHYLNPTILGSRHSTCLQLNQLLLLTTCVNNVGSNCFDEPLSIARHPSSDFAIVFLLPSTQFPSFSFLERERVVPTILHDQTYLRTSHHQLRTAPRRPPPPDVTGITIRRLSHITHTLHIGIRTTSSAQRAQDGHDNTLAPHVQHGHAAPGEAERQ